MKSARIAQLAVWGICVLLAWSVPGTAGPRLITSTGRIHTASGRGEAGGATQIHDVSDRVGKALERKLQQKSTKRLALVTVDKETLKGNELSVDLFNKRSIALKCRHRESKRSGRIVWTGTTDGYEEAGKPYASIVVNMSDDGRVVSGTVKYFDGEEYEVYRISTVMDGGNAHVVLVELDPAYIARPPY